MTSIAVQNATQAWKELLTRLLEQTTALEDQNGETCYEIRNILVHIADGSDTLRVVHLLQNQPAWVYPGADELRALMLGSGDGALEYSYARKLFGKPGVVHEHILPLLRTHKNSRRAVATLYDPRNENANGVSAVPSFLSVQCIADETLHLTVHLRSCDVLFGLPANLYEIYILQEYLARELGIPQGSLHILCTSAHLFERFVPDAQTLQASLNETA